MDSDRHPGLDRRTFLAGTLAAGGGMLLGAGTAGAAPAGFPDYRHIGVAFDKAALRYNPTNELIFPCIRGVYDKLGSRLGRYYLYYAPHDRPGGICLAYGDSLAGPFTEYPANPVIPNVWAPHYSVSHVSSPHIVWQAASRRFLMYFHGENTTTRVATSTDGVRFTYDRVVLSTADIPGLTEASYARVFEHPIAARGSRYVMVFMGVLSGRRRIYWGWSADGLSWAFDPAPLVSPGGDGQTDLSGPHVLERGGSTYVVYHGNSGRMFITEVGPGFDREVHLGVFHTPLAGAPGNGRSAAPSFGTDGGISYMFYEAGQRGSSTIAVARAV